MRAVGYVVLSSGNDTVLLERPDDANAREQGNVQCERKRELPVLCSSSLALGEGGVPGVHAS